MRKDKETLIAEDNSSCHQITRTKYCWIVKHLPNKNGNISCSNAIRGKGFVNETFFTRKDSLLEELHACKVSKSVIASVSKSCE